MANRQVNFSLVQVAVWLIVYSLMLIYNVREPGSLMHGVLLTTNNLATCLLAIYLQSHWLLPVLWERGRKPSYFLMSLGGLLALVSIRASLEYLLINRYLGYTHFYNFGTSHLALAFLTIFLSFVIGMLLRISLNYVALLKNHETLRHQQVLSELNLLKAQVQPHFMFNTLNNIYSLANKRSERTAEMVAKLSDMMHYFVRDARQETVQLSTEINLIKSYIDLETIRMIHPMDIEWSVSVLHNDCRIPPMLLIPFVENVFKHGVDKTRTDNFLRIAIVQNGSDLKFTVSNRVQSVANPKESGVGLINIKKRLAILYGHRFSLQIGTAENIFEVELKIPLHDEVYVSNR